MIATLYTLFRNLIADETTSYVVNDTSVLNFLDSAIDKLSQVSEYSFYEEKAITSADKTAGYIELSREIQHIVDTDLGGKDWDWQYGGGKKIRFIRSVNIGEATYYFRYRAKYKKFAGVVLQQSEIDMPDEALIPVILYALGLYMQTKGIMKADGEYGVIKEKAEENLRVLYGLGGNIAEEFSSPPKMMERAIELMRDLPTAQPKFFSVTM